ncbi:hypothetical protein RND81_07G128600 [Saponaria officinalis]|uniref:Cysteine-rich receptor-like protein kinase 10 n=1 Tax=Saponaria officinalis TaxID=3572 RepID=A0AAW1JPV7_SAPOF
MRKFVLVLVSILVCQFSISIDAQVTYENSGCEGTNFNYTQGSIFENNLDILFTNLKLKSSSEKFYNYTTGSGSNKVYGLFQCRFDVSLDVCSSCVEDARKKVVEECPLTGEGIVWYHECMLRYANRNFFSVYETLPGASTWGVNNVTDYDKFGPILADAMNDVIKRASSNKLYYASSETNLTLFQQLYSFAQCTPDIGTSGCNSCLKNALSKMIQCCNASVRVYVLKPSCQLRYDTTGPFLIDQPAPAPPPASNHSLGTVKKESSSMKPAIIGAIAACVAVGLLVLAVVLWICVCRKKPEVARSDVLVTSATGKNVVSARTEAESLAGDTDFEQYDFNTLKIATRDFSDENMLGEGGFGIVYKGKLENGQQLAIKRLSKGTTGQGTKEFMTEARLLAKLQHKNLVRLLGFCLEGDEKLLVYEFMPNGSLDVSLFDLEKRSLLNWMTRYKIIMGIARGLQYLHEDSRLTIIHRDLKPANILLDKEMNAKIADFGLARLFGGAQKHGNTLRIVGTQGYMAPEYLMTGDYSDKSDVYSFGIMLLEIVSGQKNRLLQRSQQREDLSIQAWKLWNEERSFELTDHVLLDNCLSNDVLRCIQIGLLCVQADAEERPTMSAVFLMLTGSIDLPFPSSPIVSSHQQHSMPMAYTGWQRSDTDQYSTKSVTMATDMEQDLYPRPR